MATERNTIPVINQSAAARFRESGDSISKHRDMVDSATFQRAIDFALIEYTASLSARMPDQFSVLSAGFKIQGVHEFIFILRNLSEKPQPMQAPLAANELNHKL